MPRAATKASSLADGPTLASTHGYWILHLRAAGRASRTFPHQLRHTRASSMLASGHSEGDVMQLGGWTDRSLLSHYGTPAAAERAREPDPRAGEPSPRIRWHPTGEGSAPRGHGPSAVAS
jgi:integrase